MMELNIMSPVFAEFLTNLNLAVIECLKETTAGNFSGGEISAKVSIEVVDASEVYAEGTSEDAPRGKELYHYQKPVIEHKVALTLKKHTEAKGSYDEKMALKQAGKAFVLIKPLMAQMSLEEMEREE